MAKKTRKPKSTAKGAPRATPRSPSSDCDHRRKVSRPKAGIQRRPAHTTHEDRLREAVFNLIGPSIKGTHALDLFAGTGALAIESLSRGSLQATLIEQHYPRRTSSEKNLATLGLEHQAEVVPATSLSGFAASPG